MLNGRKLLFEGYTKYKGSMFRLSGLEGELVVVADAEKFAEYVAAPDSVLSQNEPVNNVSSPVLPMTCYHMLNASVGHLYSIPR